MPGQKGGGAGERVVHGQRGNNEELLSASPQYSAQGKHSILLRSQSPPSKEGGR